ncbi:MAG TPA: TIGR04255 family protein, partial [Allosphingosinicella sp.]|nr:TIGR04255 family protein [Allosphingosinicella sp.]
MTRPSHLPDYGNPPLHEVVLGVQFATPAGYSQIRAGEVWSLYREDYPEVEEHPMLPASFETFGPRNRGIQPQLEFIQGASHDRFWFLSPDRTELIQFQNNRLLHNWREIPGTDITYPRFDYMIGRFESEIRKFSSYAKELSGQDININQCEVTYINNINTSEDLPNFSDWL